MNVYQGAILDWNNLNNPGNGWILNNNEFYIRGVDGKELAIYKDSVIQQWNIYGLDNVGKLVGNKKYYYMKDHLGSVRAILDEEGNVVSAQDYDYAGRLADMGYLSDPDISNPNGFYKNFTSYSYNPNSQVIEQSYGDYFTSNAYMYDNRNRVIDLFNGSSIFVYNMTYYKNGNVKTQSMYGSYRDQFENTNDIEFTYTYDRSNRLLNTYNTLASDSAFEISYTYDKDGNILTLRRYGSTNNLIDTFNYSYYSGTNKLNFVSGGKTQYTYDLNGNLITDDLNNNSNIKYDYRNLITEIYHSLVSPDEKTIHYATRYYYDEGGNRIRKLIYKNTADVPGTILDWNNLDNPGNGWVLFNNEFYIRGVNGKELAIYKDSTITQWNVYGLDNVGKLEGTNRFYYMKDHLGSVRAILNEAGEVVTAQDYDMWGYLLENRTYESDESIYKFTSKERDKETSYDYFGARYYDSRIGNFGSVDPLLEKHFDFSSYNYVLRNPLKLIDPDGKQVTPDIIFNIYSWYLASSAPSEAYLSYSIIQREAFKKSDPDYSTGRIESAEIQPSDALIIGAGILKIGLKSSEVSLCFFRLKTAHYFA